MRTTMFLWPLFLAACPAGEVSGGSSTDTGSSVSPPDLPGPPTSSGDTTDAPAGSSTGPASAADETTGTATTDPATTGGPPSLCGNGVVDPGEGCDLGDLENSDIGYCKTDCTTNICGDGDLWVGVEACDKGMGGNDGAYGGCNPDCSLAEFCGDGEPYPGEGCDAGPLNGTGEHADGFVACSATCDLEARRVFVSSAVYTGNLGGVTGADLLCRNLASAAGWHDPDRLRAWLSDGVVSPLTRLGDSQPPVPYALVNGKLVAAGLADLIASGPGDGITLDEHGAAWDSVRVWTNTAVTGDVFSAADHCAGWQSASPQIGARGGYSSVPKIPEDVWNQWSQQKWWTSQASNSCEKLYHLYCLED